MTPLPAHRHQRGVTLVELLVAMAVGVILIGAVIAVYVAQSQTYKSSNTQATIQNAENAISALVTPIVRSAGFSGCGTLASATSNLAPGVPPPLGTLGAANAMLAGYDAAGTGGPGTTLTISADDIPNDTDAAHWTPALDASLLGNVVPGSDVLVVAGAAPGVLPVAATAAVATADDGITVTNTSGFVAGSVAAISDCLKSSVFVARTVTAATGQIAHTAGGVGIANTVDTLPVAYAAGAQVVPLQQTAFFVSFDQTSGSSVLVRAIYAGGLWNVQSLVPGIETMQVLYGIGTNGAITQYVPAGAVTDWTSVYSVRLAFLLEGDTGSAGTGQGAASIPPLLGTAVIAPVDTRQRHVFEMTVNLRNAAP